jgi:hypothetical protein
MTFDLVLGNSAEGHLTAMTQCCQMWSRADASDNNGSCPDTMVALCSNRSFFRSVQWLQSACHWQRSRKQADR